MVRNISLFNAGQLSQLCHLPFSCPPRAYLLWWQSNRAGPDTAQASISTSWRKLTPSQPNPVQMDKLFTSILIQDWECSLKKNYYGGLIHRVGLAHIKSSYLKIWDFFTNLGTFSWGGQNVKLWHIYQLASILISTACDIIAFPIKG